VGVNITDPIINEPVFRSRFSNEGGVEGIRFLNNIMGTLALQELRRTWTDQAGRDVTWAEIEDLIAHADPARSVIDPDDLSFYSPGDMAGAIVAFCRRTGQHVPETRAAIARTTMESLAVKIAWARLTVEHLIGQAIEAVHIVGGGGRSGTLSQFIANATALPVRVGPIDATAVGNALVQAVALGQLDDYAQGRQIAANSFECREYTPQDLDHWQQASVKFKHLSAGLRSV